MLNKSLFGSVMPTVLSLNEEALSGLGGVGGMVWNFILPWVYWSISVVKFSGVAVYTLFWGVIYILIRVTYGKMLWELEWKICGKIVGICLEG